MTLDLQPLEDAADSRPALDLQPLDEPPALDLQPTAEAPPASTLADDFSGWWANAKIAGNQLNQNLTSGALEGVNSAQEEAKRRRELAVNYERDFSGEFAQHADPLRRADYANKLAKLQAEANAAETTAQQRVELAPELLAAVSESEQRMRELTPQLSPEMKAFSEAQNFGEWVGIMAQNPVETLANVLTSSMIVGAPAVAAAAAGSMASPLGTAAGAGLGSYSVERSQGVVDSLRQAGVDLDDPQSIEAAFHDAPTMEKARSFANARGVPIAVFDAITGGVAGRFLKPALGQGVRKVAVATANELGVQMSGGAIGETAAQVASGQPLDAKAIALEAIAEIGTAPGEIIGNLRGELARPALDLQPLDPEPTSAANPPGPTSSAPQPSTVEPAGPSESPSMVPAEAPTELTPDERAQLAREFGFARGLLEFADRADYDDVVAGARSPRIRAKEVALQIAEGRASTRERVAKLVPLGYTAEQAAAFTPRQAFDLLQNAANPNPSPPDEAAGDPFDAEAPDPSTFVRAPQGATLHGDTAIEQVAQQFASRSLTFAAGGPAWTVSRKALKKMTSDGKPYPQARIAAIQVLDDFAAKARLEAERPDDGRDPEVESIFEYVAPFEFGGQRFRARLLGKQWRPEAARPDKLHSLRLDDIELEPVGPKPSTGQRPPSVGAATEGKATDAPQSPSANAGNVLPMGVEVNPQAQARAEIEAEGPDYSPLRSVDDKGSPYANVPLAGLPNLRIVEMPEMVQLAQELGAEFLLKQMPKARGQFSGIGNGRVKLDPRIFSNPIDAAKTMMHEIGHLIDWLPSKTLSRGNLWGRLHSLRKYMQEKFAGPIKGRTNSELRDELIALTKHWKPYDPATDPPSYVKYRESAVELYADFISVLYNSPATAKQIAPKFYHEFFRGIDTKPDVKTALFELQAWLQRPVRERLKDRAANVETMFAKGESIFLRKWEEKQARFAGYRGWFSRLKQAAFDHFAPVRDRAGAVGGETKQALDQLFDAHPMANNEHYRWLEHLHRTVIEPAEKAGLSMDDLGQWLFFDRVANESFPVSESLAKTLGVSTGGRTTIANPLGHTPKTARDQLLIARLNNGMRRQTLLDDAARRFHDTVRAVMREAHDAGLLTDEQLGIIEQNAQHYAAFTPLEYVDTFVPAGFFHQSGTLKEIASPFLSTVLKVLQMQRAIQFQKIKTATVKLLSTHFSGEIQPAAVRHSTDGRTQPVPPRARGVQQIMLREAGRPAWYNVPAEIAAMFDRPDVPLLESTLGLLGEAFRHVFYPLFITYNPIFQLVRNPMRDARRSYVNAPAGVGFWSIVRQLPLIKQVGPNEALDGARALVRKGIQTPLIAEMLDNLAITPGEATFTATAGKPIDALDKILEQHGLLPSTEQPDAVRRVFGKIGLGGLADAIATMGRINELLPKAAMYKALRAQGWAPRDAAYYVRNFIGTPNFTRRGTHIGLANNIVPFINIWMKGWAADASLASKGFKRRTHPDEPGKSAASWWMRWAMTSGGWTMLKVAAGIGLFGAALKKLLDGIGSFDKTNYDVLPVGYSGKSEFNPQGKVAYFKVPKDPTDRILSGVTYNTLNAIGLKLAKAGVFGSDVQQMNAGADDRLGVALTKNFSVAAGDVPGLNPLLKIGNGWRTYAMGQNPIDDFRGSPILSDAEHLVGGTAALKPMLTWTIGQTGLQSFIRFDPETKTWTEIAAQNLPLVNGAVRISDYGFREQQLLGERLEDTQSAAARLALPANARQLNSEHSFLRALGATDRTPDQEQRYLQLRAWHSSIWMPAEQMLRDAEEMRLSPEARKRIITGTEAASRGFEKR